jgi:hypothetical protein
LTTDGVRRERCRSRESFLRYGRLACERRPTGGLGASEEASRFYEHLGWSVVTQEEYEGESVVVMVPELRR